MPAVGLSRPRTCLLEPTRPSSVQVGKAPDTTLPIRFASLKGLNLPFGVQRSGTSGSYTWWGAAWDEAAIREQLKFLRSYNITDLRFFMFFDDFIVKDANWSTGVWTPQFYPAYRANWETFARMCKEAGIRMFPCLYSSPLSGANMKFDPVAMYPAWRGPDLLGTGTNNGGMESNPLVGNGWTYTDGNATETYYTDEAQGVQPGDNKATSYVGLVKTDAQATKLESPKVAYDGKTLLRISINVKGSVAITPYLNYYNAAGTLTGTMLLKQVTLAGGGVWETYTIGTQTNPPLGGVTQVTITIQVAVASTVYIGGCRIAPADRSWLWKNYVEAARAWCQMYNDQTEIGSNISAWNTFNEIYDNLIALNAHPWAVDCYNAIRSVTRTPVSMDSTTSYFIGTAGNLPWYKDCCDIADIHKYDTDPTAIPDLSSLGTLPWILGEAGASSTASPGTPQRERVTCTTAVTVGGAGNLTVTVNSSLAGFPQAESVAVANNDSAVTYAAKIRRQLLTNATITGSYRVLVRDAGAQQVETTTVVAAITGAGNAAVTVTAAGMPGSPITVSIPLQVGDDSKEVARKIAVTLTAHSVIGAWFYFLRSGAVIAMTAHVQAANDATMNIAIADGTPAPTGLTAAATSTNTTTGSGTAKVTLTRRIASEVTDDTLGITVVKATAVGPDDVSSVTDTASTIGGYAALDTTIQGFAAEVARRGGKCIMPWDFNGMMAVAGLFPALTASSALVWERDWTP